MYRRVLVLLSSLIAAVALTGPVSAHANLVRAEPAIGASVLAAPAIVRLSFSETPEPRYSEIDIYNAALERFDKRDLHAAPDDTKSLIVGVGDLPQDVYTVVWRTTSAVDGHTTGGSFAFSVGAAAITGGATTQSVVTFSRPTPLDVTTKWLAYVGLSIFLGAVVLGMFVWTPALRSAASTPDVDEELAARVRVRLTLLVSCGLVVLTAATAIGAVAQVAKATGRSLIGALDPAALHGYLIGTRTGNIWCARYFVGYVAAVLLSPIMLRRLSTDERRSALLHQIAARAGLAVGVVEVFTFSLMSHGAATAFNKPVTILFDAVHLVAAAIWIGGLAALVATVPLIPQRRDQRHSLLRALVVRFSAMALAGVGLLIVTGLFMAWVQIGSLGALRTTDYGKVLLLKIAVVAGAIPFAALNLLWVRPRLAAPSRKTFNAVKETTKTSDLFRRSIRGEVILGVIVLLVVAALTGLAPSRQVIVETAGSSLARSATADDLQITLTPSTLQPAETTYDILVNKGSQLVNADRVTMRFASRDLGIAETEAVAASRGEGHYVLTGAYTTIAGVWQTRVIVRRNGHDDASATFDVPIGATGAATNPQAAATPRVSARVLLYGLAATVLVLIIFVGVAALSNRLAREPTAPATRRAQGTAAGALLVAYLCGAVGLYYGFTGPSAVSGATAQSSRQNEVHMATVGPGLFPDPNAPHLFVGGTKTIRAGTTITFINDDIHPHDVVSGRYGTTTGAATPTPDPTNPANHVHSGGIAYPDNRFSSDVLEPGQQWQYTFTTKGVYPYICTLHPGMEAVITVT